MKKITLAASALALTLLAVPAQANEEFMATCKAYAEENSVEVDCSCLDKAGEENPALFDEYAKVSTPDDVELMSDEAQEAAAQCSAE